MFVCRYVAPPGECYYNTLLCRDYFSSSSVVLHAFSALCSVADSIVHTCQKTSKHTSLIYYLSFLPDGFFNAYLDMYVMQAVEVCVLLLPLCMYLKLGHHPQPLG